MVSRPNGYSKAVKSPKQKIFDEILFMVSNMNLLAMNGLFFIGSVKKTARRKILNDKAPVHMKFKIFGAEVTIVPM